MENRLLVEPQVLHQIAGEFQGKATTVQALLRDMLTKVENTRDAFQGERADEYRYKFASLETPMNTLYQMIINHVNNVNQIADSFIDIDNPISNMTQQLSTPEL